MHLEEIINKVEDLKVSPSSTANPLKTAPTTETAPQDATASPAPSEPEAPTAPSKPVMGPAEAPRRTPEEIMADLNKSPLFMTSLEENDDIAALQALAYEGTPLENASEFKERGNESFKERGFSDAREFYGKGINILWHEERRRANGEPPSARKPAERAVDKEVRVPGIMYEEEGEREVDWLDRAKPADEEEEVVEEDTPELVAKQRAVLESLYVNRAAAHLELQNYRSCWLDCAAALRLNPTNVKALYRSARALLKVDRVDEADDACARGLAIDPQNKALLQTAKDIIARAEVLAAKRRREEERLAKEKYKEDLLAAAVKARGIHTRSTEKPPEMEDARMRLVPDEADPTSSLSFPVVLLYPAHLETDFIKAFNETETLAEHLAYVFPLPWDERREYTVDGVECYVETVSGGLVKMGKKVALLKVLAGGKVEVVDQVVKIFVVPKAKAEGWVKEFKEQKAKEMAVKK